MKTVLVIEDDPVDAVLLIRIFEKLELRAKLQVIKDGQAAIDYLRRAAGAGDGLAPIPDVVLLDLKLPRKSGLEVLRWIRNEGMLRYLPVVILTSSRLEGDLVSAYAAGANSYLVKTPDQQLFARMMDVFHSYWIELNESALKST